MRTSAMHLTQPLWLKHFTHEHPHFWAHATLALVLAVTVFAIIAATWIATAHIMNGLQSDLSAAYLGTFAALASIVLFPGFLPALIAAFVLPVLAIVSMVWLLVKAMHENGFFESPHKHQKL